MKNLIKGELYLLRKQITRFLLVPLLMLTYFVGIVFVNGLHKQALNEAHQNYASVATIVATERSFDICALKRPEDRKYVPDCKDINFTNEDIEIARKRNPLNSKFSSHLNRMNYWMMENHKEGYMEERIKMLESAKRMEEAGFNNAFYFANDLNYPEDNIIIDEEINMIKDILDNNYQIQLTPFDMNATNYLRVFFSNGGMVAFIMVILLANMDIFVSENSPDVNNVVYTQTYSRAKINISKIVASIIYSLISLVASVFLSHIIIGLIYGFGSVNYPLYMRPDINTFQSVISKTFIISNIFYQLIYISSMTLLLLVCSLIIMHLITVLFQNSNPGLFLLYFLLTFRFILKDTIGVLFKYIPFSYDNMYAVFNNDYSYIYGFSMLVIFTVVAFVTLIYVGNRIDLKGGD